VSDKLERKAPASVKEKGQYLLAFGIVASMLLVAGFPMFVVFFFGIFAYFLFRMFSSSSRSETREVFEFYLTANEILRDDERRWYGFEIREAVRRCERSMQTMRAGPPLLHFSLGALYNKMGDHAAAVRQLSQVVESASVDESTMFEPSNELRNYVRVLRKIERDPADAPLTSAAVRALERARRIRGTALLEESRQKLATSAPSAPEPTAADRLMPAPQPFYEGEAGGENGHQQRPSQPSRISQSNGKRGKRDREEDFGNRKPISEVLHDIYDRNIQ
jgi:hypothetical protein